MKNLQEQISRMKSMMRLNENKTYQIYVDMGGVLFKKMGADEGGSGNETDYIGSELWESIKKYYPIILTSTGSKNIENSEKIKTKQVQDYLNPIPKIKFVVSGPDKKTFATTTQDDLVYPNILIDDSETNIKEWESNGGIGIVHKNNQSTLEQLESYIK